MSTERTMVAARRYTRLAGAQALWLYERGRLHRHRLLAAAVALGILFMVIHWG